MLKKFILSTIATTAILSAHAQQVTLSWSAESKNNVTYSGFVKGSSNELIKLCFEENNDMPLFKSKSITPIMTSYSDKLAEVRNQSIYVTENDVKFNNLLSIKENLFFFTNIYDKKSKSTTYYCQPIDIKTLKNNGDNVNLGTMQAFKKSEQSTVTYQLSEDSTKVLMMGLSPYSKVDVEKYFLSVHDHKMNKLWDKTIEMPYKDKEIIIFNQLVTNDGKVAVLIKHFDSGTEKEQIKRDGKKVPSYTTKLLLYSKDEATPHEFTINIGDKFVHSLAIAKEKNNELFLFGLYQQKSEGNINGYFLTHVNTNTKNTSSTNINSFPLNLLEVIKNDKQGSDSDKDGGLGLHFKFVKMETRENGDRDFILEYREKYYVSSKYGTYAVYNHGNIIDINVKTNGTNVITRIPKLQNSIENPNASGFKTMVYKDKLLLFYNDKDDNLEQDLSKKPKETKLGTGGRKVLGGTADAFFTMATIDAQGNLTRSILMDKKQSKFITAVNVSLPLDKNKLALYAIRGSKDMIGLLEVK